MFKTHEMAILISFLSSLKGFILTLKELQFRIIIFKAKPAAHLLQTVEE